MQNELTGFYTAVMSVDACAMFILMYIAEKSNTLNQERKRLFSLLFAAVFVAGSFEWLGVILDGYDGFFRYAHIIVKIIEFSIAPAIPMLLCWIINKKWVKPAVAFLAVHAAIEIFCAIFGFIFYIDEQSIYRHGDQYWIYVLAYSAASIYGLIFLFINTRKYQYNGISQCIMIAMMLVLDIGIQLETRDIRVIYIGVGMGASMLYITVLEMIQQTDGLTDLLNRISFDNHVASQKETCTVLFFDLDSFKCLNDYYGHAYGDTVLENVGNAIRETYSPYGKCYRYGGDEFCVILTKSLDQVDTLNEEFTARIHKFQEADDRMPYVSVGYATFHPETETMKDVVNNADLTMYEAKRKRKSELEEKKVAETV